MSKHYTSDGREVDEVEITEAQEYINEVENAITSIVHLKATGYDAKASIWEEFLYKTIKTIKKWYNISDKTIQIQEDNPLARLQWVDEMCQSSEKFKHAWGMLN